MATSILSTLYAAIELANAAACAAVVFADATATATGWTDAANDAVRATMTAEDAAWAAYNAELYAVLSVGGAPVDHMAPPMETIARKVWGKRYEWTRNADGTVTVRNYRTYTYYADFPTVGAR